MPNTAADAPAAPVAEPRPPEAEDKAAAADGAAAAPAAPPPKEVPVPAAYLESTTHHLPSLDAYHALYARSVTDPAAFWSDIAREFHWHKPWPADTPPIAWNYDPRAGPVFTHFWKGGQTNVCYNALDVHVAAGGGDTVAFYFEPNDPDDGRARSVTYAALLADVCRTAHALRAAGVCRGDAVVTYMPMGVELPTVMLAAARIGAVHSVVFGGFSPVALAGRLVAANAAVMVTCDGVRRGAKWIDFKAVADEAVAIAARENGHTVRSQIVVASGSRPTGGGDVPMTPGRDVWWEDALQGHPTTCEVVWVDAEDPLFCLFTSGSTGPPKGIVHTVGGYMVGAATTFKYSFNYMPGDVFFCTADCGWITVRMGVHLDGRARGWREEGVGALLRCSPYAFFHLRLQAQRHSGLVPLAWVGRGAPGRGCAADLLISRLCCGLHFPVGLCAPYCSPPPDDVLLPPHAGPHVCHVRTAAQQGHPGSIRRDPYPPRRRPAMGHRGQVWRHGCVHGADSVAVAQACGRRLCDLPQQVLPQDSGHGRGAHQS